MPCCSSIGSTRAGTWPTSFPTTPAGSSMRAAVAAVRKLGPARVVVAVPVGAASTCADIQSEADEVVCAQTPDPFFAVGSWYEDFGQTTDEEVRELLGRREAASVP